MTVLKTQANMSVNIESSTHGPCSEHLTNYHDQILLDYLKRKRRKNGRNERKTSQLETLHCYIYFFCLFFNYILAQRGVGAFLHLRLDRGVSARLWKWVLSVWPGPKRLFLSAFFVPYVFVALTSTCSLLLFGAIEQMLYSTHFLRVLHFNLMIGALSLSIINACFRRFCFNWDWPKGMP